MNKRFLALITAPALFLVPAVANAQDRFRGLESFFQDIIYFINNTLIPLTFAVALLIFLYAVARYFIAGGGNEDTRKDAVQLMLYSIGGFVLMVGIFGIVNLIANGLGLTDDQTLESYPQARESSGGQSGSSNWSL